jgi:exopolysaccharide biosynthesis protein
MTLQEFSHFLTAHGITDALNLDGGGSTTLVVGGRIVNRPSDTNGERAVSNALLVIDQSQARACTGKR